MGCLIPDVAVGGVTQVNLALGGRCRGCVRFVPLGGDAQGVAWWVADGFWSWIRQGVLQRVPSKVAARLCAHCSGRLLGCCWCCLVGLQLVYDIVVAAVVVVVAVVWVCCEQDMAGRCCSGCNYWCVMVQFFALPCLLPTPSEVAQRSADQKVWRQALLGSPELRVGRLEEGAPGYCAVGASPIPASHTTSG